MKRLTQSEIVQIGATSESEAREASAGILDCCPSYAGDKQDLYKEWRAGRVEANTIQVEDKPTFVVFWRVEMGGGLLVVGAFSLAGGNDRFAALVAGIEDIARKNSCTYGLLQSARAGMAKKVEAYGGRPVAVTYAIPVRNN